MGYQKYQRRDDLKRPKSQIEEIQYRGIFDLQFLPRPWILRGIIPSSALVLDEVDTVLAKDTLAPPHGLDVLLTPPPAPAMPTLPSWTQAPVFSLDETEALGRVRERIRREYEEISKDASLQKEVDNLRTKIAAKSEAIDQKMRQDQARGAELATGCRNRDLAAIRLLMLTCLARHPLPEPLVLNADFVLDNLSRVALCTIQVPDLSTMPIVKKSATKRWQPVSEAQRKRCSERILHALCIRAAYLIAMSDPGSFFDTVAVNAHQKWFDPATGSPREGIVASLQGAKSELCQLQPGHLDPKACFRHLGGISTANILNAAPVRPIFVMDRNDDRIVANKDVASQIEEQTNLAAMPWEDFEHLVSQLFEWMFTNDGVEIKVTRASRDRGVDAIMFDPDPIRGGKYVLQAKRYTRTVDVAAVRDLYGTVVNEGANRGILVTTASYGPVLMNLLRTNRFR